MKFRGLIAAAIVLLALAGTLYWSERHEAKKALETPTISTPAILRLDPSTITALDVKQKGAQGIQLVRSGAQWQITAPNTYPADAGAVSNMLTTLSPLNAQSVVEDHASNLTEFGLSDPAVEIDVTTKDSKTSRLLLGDDTPTGDGVYVAVAGDSRVFVASSFVKTSLNKGLSDLRDKRLLPVDASSVSSIELIRKGDDITFARIQNGWQIEKPKTYRSDNFQVDDLLQQLTTAKWDESAPSADTVKTFAHAALVASVKLTGSFGNDTLEVRKDKEDYYARSSVVAGVWKVDSTASSTLGQAMDHSLDDFRNKQIFAFGDSDPEKIECHSGATNFVLTHNNNAWWSNGQKMDTVSVESLIAALRELSASKFVDSGFTTPLIEITVTSDGSKRIEKVQIQKTGDSGIAKLEGDSSLYALDATTINSLTNAIAGLKPASQARK